MNAEESLFSRLRQWLGWAEDERRFHTLNEQVGDIELQDFDETEQSREVSASSGTLPFKGGQYSAEQGLDSSLWEADLDDSPTGSDTLSSEDEDNLQPLSGVGERSWLGAEDSSSVCWGDQHAARHLWIASLVCRFPRLCFFTIMLLMVSHSAPNLH